MKKILSLLLCASLTLAPLTLSAQFGEVIGNIANEQTDALVVVEEERSSQRVWVGRTVLTMNSNGLRPGNLISSRTMQNWIPRDVRHIGILAHLTTDSPSGFWTGFTGAAWVNFEGNLMSIGRTQISEGNNHGTFSIGNSPSSERIWGYISSSRNK